jgi:hypothetical protein
MLIINGVDQSELLQELGQLILRLNKDGSVTIEPVPTPRPEMSDADFARLAESLGAKRG